MNSLKILITSSSKDYALVDSGDGEKLERFGRVLLSRPDPQAIWRKKLDKNEWSKADGHFSGGGRDGKWVMKEAKEAPKKWSIDFGGLKLWIKPTAFKHTGLFPEQYSNWDWLRETLAGAIGERKEIEVLNLFAYTGGATLACAQAGVKVVHIDSSKSAITWAKENAELSGLSDKPIRWILEDARLFVEREIKRGRKYDGIIMDPPAFGHGTEKELWKIEEHLLPLIENCMKILKDKPLFFIINGYSAGYSALAYENILRDLHDKSGGTVEIGELAIEESDGGRLLPAGIFARWRMI